MKSDTFANRYKILETIGRGGMGVVYKATDLMLDKTVALKVLSEKISDQAALRFQAEAKAAGMLNHPNIVLVLDFGVSEDGEPYMVMEYIDGSSLADLVKPSGLEPLERSLEIFQQICRALAQAHERGIIHRDIKPSNVIVATDEDGEPLAKLTDFGIAKLIEADQGLTSQGTMIGSPLYMSPEQVRGETLDARSDIYSLGCLMFETLCGSPPLKGETQLETARMCQSVEPPPLSTVASRPVPSEIETIVGRCLKKSKDGRYQKVKDLLSELSSVSTSLEISQPEIGEGAEINESAPPNKGRFNTVTLLAVPFFILIAIGLFYFTSVLQNSPEPAEPKTSSDQHVFPLSVGDNKSAEKELEAAEKIDSRNHPSETDKPPDSLELTNGGTTVHLYNASPAGLKKVCDLHRGIHELEIFGGTTFDGTHLKYLALLPRLRYLKMTDVPLRDEKLSELVGADQLDRLKFEYIDSIKGPGLDHIARLQKLNDFSDMRINLTDELLTHLQRVPVSKLSLKGCRDMNKERMRVFRNMPHLKSLVLENMLLKDDMLTPLAGLKLKEIRLGENNDLTKACFSTLKTMKKLERIGFNECPGISADSFQKLAEEMNLVYDANIEYLVRPDSSQSD